MHHKNYHILHKQLTIAYIFGQVQNLTELLRQVQTNRNLGINVGDSLHWIIELLVSIYFTSHFTVICYIFYLTCFIICLLLDLSASKYEAPSQAPNFRHISSIPPFFYLLIPTFFYGKHTA